MSTMPEWMSDPLVSEIPEKSFVFWVKCSPRDRERARKK